VIQKDVIEATGLSSYIVTLLSKKYSLGEHKGKYRVYSEKDITFLEMMAHYRKYKHGILKLYNCIKKYPGIGDTELRKKAGLTNYQYNTALAELSFVCNIYEEDRPNKRGKDKPVYFIDGEFFPKYMKVFYDTNCGG
jgi:hypothetical protein